jgi:hypothetical protein
MRYRIKEAGTDRVWVNNLESAIPHEEEVACAALLATHMRAKRLTHLGPMQLQAWTRAGWTDVGSPQGG